MTETLLIQLSLFSLLAPLAGFLLTLLFGKRISGLWILNVSVIVLVMISSGTVLFSKIVYFKDAVIHADWNWIYLPELLSFKEVRIDASLKIDNLSAIMLAMVSFVSMVVHFFSIGYMKGDPRFNRFFAYLGIFTFSMFGIVLTNSMFFMYVFWELVGLSSFLLIGFWYEKQSASDAAKKAFIVNRIGDMGMLAGILMLFVSYGTFSFDQIFAQMSQGIIPFDSGFWLTVTGILLFCGAIGKSAQFPLHVWLPDAMEGPTPVSALIHAATMVAAGVYLVVRLFPIMSADALTFIAVIGLLSAFIPATIAITQRDIKKVLAYSTISQLGYMILSLGVGGYAFGFMHLITHAFFKAGLFLGAGSVIHAMHHEQDISSMGGLKKKLPVTFVTFLIFTLAISGIPLTSGFMSKDGILASTLAYASFTGNYVFAIGGFLTAGISAYYMFRLLFLTFFGTPRDEEKYHHAKESPAVMTFPLILLALLSLSIAFSLNPLNAEKGWFLGEWIHTPQSVVPEEFRHDFMIEDNTIHSDNAHITHSAAYTEVLHKSELPSAIISLSVALIGILLAYFMYMRRKNPFTEPSAQIRQLYKLSLNKWYFDEIYEVVFIGSVRNVYTVLQWIDTYIIDGIVNLTAAITRLVSRLSNLFDVFAVDAIVNTIASLSALLGSLLRRLQTGKVQTYITLAVFSIFVILLYLLTQ